MLVHALEMGVWGVRGVCGARGADAVLLLLDDGVRGVPTVMAGLGGPHYVAAVLLLLLLLLPSRVRESGEDLEDACTAPILSQKGVCWVCPCVHHPPDQRGRGAIQG